MSFVNVLELAYQSDIVPYFLGFFDDGDAIYQPPTTETPPVTVLPDITFMSNELEATKQHSLLGTGQPKRISKLGRKITTKPSQDFATSNDYFGSVTHKSDPFETERAAYWAMNDMLVDKHFGQFVAIYGSDLVDYDSDPEALIKRVRAAYGNTGVFIQKISNEPERIIRLRLPNRINT